MADKPMVVLVATYADMDSAELDYKAVLALHNDGDLGHLAAAIVTKAADGKLKIQRHDTTAKHLAWLGAALGALLAVIVPPLGLAFLTGGFLAGVVVEGAIGAGIGGLVGHYWKQIPKDDVRAMGDLLESGQAGLAVVAVEKKQADVDAAVTRAERKIVKEIENGDVEGAYKEALEASAKDNVPSM
jgi:uncharacterized membrane protein